MNELIEELFEQYARLFMNDKAEMLFTDFRDAIQTACKVQRNACKREFDEHYPWDASVKKEIIQYAKIERCDYE